MGVFWHWSFFRSPKKTSKKNHDYELEGKLHWTGCALGGVVVVRHRRPRGHRRRRYRRHRRRMASQQLAVLAVGGEVVQLAVLAVGSEVVVVR